MIGYDILETARQDFRGIAQQMGYEHEVAKWWYEDFLDATKGRKDLQTKFFLVLDKVNDVDEVIHMFQGGDYGSWVLR